MPKHNQRRGIEACLFKQARKCVPKDHRAAGTAGKIGARALIFMPVTPKAEGTQMIDGVMCLAKFSNTVARGENVSSSEGYHSGA